MVEQPVSRRHSVGCRPLRLIACLVTMLVSLHLLGELALSGELPKSGLPRDEIMHLGERMYREGILPSGAVMPAFIREDVDVDSTAFSCSSCHLRAGLGSYEGGVVTPPTNGVKLYKPYRRPPSLNDVQDQSGRYIYNKTVQERPAYSRGSLAYALRFGKDPAGQVFNDVMPRYPLTQRDMSVLVDYLELLSAEPSPGASATMFEFATIITDDVSEKDREALLTPLRKFISLKNQQLDLYNEFLKFGYIPTIDMKYAFRNASLDVWELKGPPGTWPAQLESYYAKNPVFAVLGGITNGDWKPMHDFCESKRLPCLFPITDFPVVSETGWYTYYFNKGYEQEGDAVARYLNRSELLKPGTRVLQLVQDAPAGRALASGFRKAWLELEHTAAAEVTLGKEQLRDGKALRAVVEKEKADLVLIWADAEVVPHLTEIVSGAAAPKAVFLSSTWLGAQSPRIDEAIRDRIYLAFPYRLTPYLGPQDGSFNAKVPILASSRAFGDRRITSRTTAMLRQVALRGLNLLYDNLYRDHLLDVMSMQMDVNVLDYERFSFGPGQRYVSKGCYIAQLGPGDEPELLPRSEWVVH